MLLALGAAAVLCGQELCGQDDAARFDRALAAIPGGDGDPAAVRTAAAAALDVFLRLADDAARRQRLPAAVAVAKAAGDHRLAVQLAGEARQCGLAGPAVVQAHLQSLCLLGRIGDFVAQAKDDEAAGRWDAVAAALLAQETLLLPAADRLLRTGKEDGLWIFGAVSRAAPADGVRTANLALAWRHVGNLRAAEEVYRQALAAAPADEQIWNDYGLFLRATGRAGAAVDAFWRSYAQERHPGEGPAITNLVHGEVLAPGSVAPDPLPKAAQALLLRPDAVMLRRVTLDLVLARQMASAVRQEPDRQEPYRQEPDSGAPRR